MPKQIRLLAAFGFLVLLAACTSHETRTYSAPSVGTKLISSLAILPVRNAPIAQSESIQMNRELTQAVQRKNPTLSILGPVEAVERLNEQNLVEDYDRYIVGLAQSGIPNKAILARIGAALGVDAIMQGQILGLAQQDGGWGGRYPSTTFSLRYSIVSTGDGLVLWEIVEEIRKTRSAGISAPSLQKVLPDAIQVVIQRIPVFTFVSKPSK